MVEGGKRQTSVELQKQGLGGGGCAVVQGGCYMVQHPPEQAMYLFLYVVLIIVMQEMKSHSFCHGDLHFTVVDGVKHAAI